VKPYVWRGVAGWYLSRGKSPVAYLKAEYHDTWDEAMAAAHALIAHEPS
jgi:hypothetical protein